MKLKEKVIPLILTAFTLLSCSSFSVFAENDTSSEVQTDNDGYISSGDYKYSLSTDEDGNQVAYLEEYTGTDTEIELPEEIDGYTVKGLGDYTFYENDKITEVTLSENFEEFGNFPFYGCTSIMEFRVNEKNELFEADRDGAVVSRDGASLMAYPTGKNPEKYTVADGIIGIRAGTFALCKNLKEITLPDTLDFIGIYAFAECTSLEKIVLPDKITELEDFTFSGCTALSDVTLPKNLQKIDNAVFFDCQALELIEFPETLGEIGQAAFCSTGITSITIPPTIYGIGYSAFGFHTDEQEQIVADESFVIMGYNGSYAQTYAKENDIEFVSIDEPETQATEAGTTTKKKTVPPGVIAGICVVCAAAIVLVIVIVVKKGRNNDVEEDSDEYDDTEEQE